MTTSEQNSTIEDFVVVPSFMVKHMLLLDLCSYTAKRRLAPKLWSATGSFVWAMIFVLKGKRSTSGDKEFKETREKMFCYIYI